MANRIESQQNKLIKQIKGLVLKKNRDKEGLFLAEGTRFVSEIPLDWGIHCFVVSDKFAQTNNLTTLEERAKTYIVSDTLFSSLSDTETPQGILAVCEKKADDIRSIFQKDNLFFLIAEELQDPGNLGTIIRTADACNADAIFLCENCVDVYNPKVLRSTMGSVFHLPIIQSLRLNELADILKKADVPLYAAHLDATKTPYDLQLQNSCAFLIGNEGRGLTQEAAKLCNEWVRIPMPGQAESLNASIAAGVLLYEVVRQRMNR